MIIKCEKFVPHTQIWKDFASLYGSTFQDIFLCQKMKIFQQQPGFYGSLFSNCWKHWCELDWGKETYVHHVTEFTFETK